MSNDLHGYGNNLTCFEIFLFGFCVVVYIVVDMSKRMAYVHHAGKYHHRSHAAATSVFLLPKIETYESH